jgi:hypothetical protein
MPQEYGCYIPDDETVETLNATIEAADDTQSGVIRELVKTGLRVDGSKPKHVASVYEVRLTFTPFQCTVIGNRLWQAASQRAGSPTEAEVKSMARRFHQKGKLARDSQESDVLIELSSFEARFIGDWLHEAGTCYDDRIKHETRLLRDRFHDAVETRADE